MTAPAPSNPRFIGRVEHRRRVRDAFAVRAPAFPLAGELAYDTWGAFRVRDGHAHLEGKVLARPGSARADVYRLAARHRLDPLHPPAVLAEAAAVAADPGIDDPALDDHTSKPFVTIDEPHSKDLDQALFLERRGAGYAVWYAIADPAWSVRPGTALFAEALRRGASYYLPGLTIRMLPPELSEGVVSLNPDVDRRALLFELELGDDGALRRTRIHRARIRSRVKTSYAAVQAFYDGREPVPGGDPGVAGSLELLREVGERRIALAARRDVVAVRRREIAVSIPGGKGLRYVAQTDPRRDVERYNEQISLLCNVEGARFLHEGDRPDDGIEPIYRVHDPPAPERLARLEAEIAALVRLYGLDEARWLWRPKRESLAGYLRRLPEDGPHARIARALHRQALVAGGRSSFTAVPGTHYGVGADVYGRFTAPMREIVGIFLHKETWEKLGLARRELPAGHDDEVLRRQVIEVSNRARVLQRQLDRDVNREVLDQLFGDDLRRPLGKRPWRPGTILGIARFKVHVGLDEPPIDVKIYFRHLERQLGRLAHGDDGVTLRRRDDGKELYRLGQAVELRVRGRDRRRDRWNLELRPAPVDE